MEQVSSCLKSIAFKMAADRSITFLGTGPAKPIVERRGKNRRMNTSSLISFKGKNYLIDTSPTLEETEFDYLLLTHLHSDAYGGFDKIRDRKFVLAVPGALSRDIDHQKDKPWERQVLKLNDPNKVGGMSITPFKVIHDIIYDYPTFGYQFIFPDGYKMTYSSDMVRVPENAEKYFDGIDMLVTDGAGWESNLATHFGVFPFLNLAEEKKWKIGKIYFTQIGRPVPEYSAAQKKITKKNPDASLTYDGQKVNF